MFTRRPPARGRRAAAAAARTMLIELHGRQARRPPSRAASCSISRACDRRCWRSCSIASSTNCGLRLWRAGVRHDQLQLRHRVLQIVHHERREAVVGLELPALGQPAIRLVLREMRRHVPRRPSSAGRGPRRSARTAAAAGTARRIRPCDRAAAAGTGSASRDCRQDPARQVTFS